MSRSQSGPVKDLVGNLSLGAKGVLVVAIPVFALLIAMGVFYQFQQQGKSASRSAQHSYETRSETRRVLTLLVNAETGIRGFLLTDREAFLEPYQTALQELPSHTGALESLMRGDPAQSSRLEHLKNLVNATLQSLDRMRQEVASHRAPSVDLLESGKANMDALRAELGAIEQQEQRELGANLESEKQAQRKLELAIFVGGLFGLLGGTAAMLLFTGSISRRVLHLEDQARRVAQGLPVDDGSGTRDEVGRLETTLKQTSDRIRRESEELVEARAELEKRVEQRTVELTGANEKLRQSNEVRQAVIQSSPLAIWALDLDGKVTFWNPAAERIFGWTEAEVIGHPLPIVPPAQQEEYREWLDRFHRGESISGVERSRLKKDGGSIDVAIWTAPLRHADGRISGTIAIDSDVSDRKMLEEQFRQSQKLEAVGRLAGGVAHDFNNLLTVITGYAEMVIAEAQGMPDLLEFAQEIQHATNRAAALTAQLLAFSRRQISQPRILDLNEVVTHSMKLLRRIIGEDIDISTHLAPGLGRIKADPIHIDQVIMNLVINARDAMADGGRLTIETANQTLDADYVGRHIGVEPGPYCMLAISDTGTGMDANTRSRLFEPFFTTKEAGKGTGLGLSIVYGVVKQNNGEIMVYSEPGKGTTFKIYFPLAATATDSSGAQSSQEEARGTETILLCEDESAIRKLVHAMLTKCGYQVIDAESPEEAIRVSREASQPIHLLLTDIVMPQVSGFELAKVVRGSRPDIRCLFMSGYTDNQVSRNWVLEADTPFIQKPFTAAALTQKVREALASSATA